MSTSIISTLSGEAIDWYNRQNADEVDPVTEYTWAYSLATFADGTAITPRGHVITEEFADG